MSANINLAGDKKALFSRVRTLLAQLHYMPVSSSLPSGKFGMIIIDDVDGAGRELSTNNNPAVLQELLALNGPLAAVMDETITVDELRILNKYFKILPQVRTILYKLDPTGAMLMSYAQKNNNVTTARPYKISEILESMLQKSNNQKAETDRKRNTITKLLEQVNLSLETDYTDFYRADVLQQIAKNIKNDNLIKGDTKRKYVRYIKDLITHANAMEPDVFKTNLINVLPDFAKTPKSQKNPHLPYTKEHLKQMFNPADTYFQTHQDDFWVCMLALFTGARTNAAVTLQYGDIITKDGMDCIYFKKNHEVKQLKTEASERIVPIASQLLKLGFVDYVKQQKAKNKVADTDFIFSKCRTKTGKYNNKYSTRGPLKHFEEIGIKTHNGPKYDFHSFRKNANQCLEDAGVPGTYINEIIGWEGKDTREQSYSQHTLQQIKVQADKMRYDFLQPEFDAWAEYFRNN